MNFHTEHLRRGSAMTGTSADDASLTVVYGEGGGCTLIVSGGIQAIFLPLHGSLRVTASSFTGSLCTGEAIVCGDDADSKVVGNAQAKWVAILGGKRAWERILDALGMSSKPSTQLLPVLFAASRELRREAIALVRASTTASRECASNAVVDSAVALQAPLWAAISRCPGRTRARRMSVFLRLQCVRNHIVNCCDQNVNYETLARMANYSPTHFLCVFKRVFEETPHKLQVEERLRRARQLLYSSDFSIAEIALASGFESRCAFSRLFHKRFGTTANEMRRQFRVSVGLDTNAQRDLAACTTKQSMLLAQ